ncbi:unnamed protein product [Adineta ricciae]|uniref:MD-2-related lipid-recognition domain-containing protein n=1 Tax=Adineta ricciae TaxID=249248 RepID=A0A815MVE7_ADIRI|nr:unnamed protein product [Adineta ricciae]
MQDNLAFVSLILFLQITIGFSYMTWEQCNNNVEDIKLLNLIVHPDPIIAPGSVSITITFHTESNLTTPLKAVISLRKKILIGYFPVPCTSIGSCVYDDLCTVCAQCNCSVQMGEHTFTLPITIGSGSWMLSGSYQAQIDLITGSGRKLCIAINNISIKTKK